ncbi:P-loop containing nucleoside triphosphate hydrolase protein [Rhizoctonia solani]|uniref:P-loop containing nucleoside triphosphate hydrolase protein n=1 Tax=Rhizoctonia solani TaxID=456999 RepID=A0A8H7M650_9AGAM|nr:P-loop containing nucleoside triphosphate hydrolase protein [Rhizoctonia solani]
MLPEPPPDVEACLDSITCILGISLTAIVPAIALVIVALHVLGLEPPKIPIFTQFITEDDIVAVEVEEAANNTKPKATPPPDADIPTERSSLLPNSGTQATRPDSWRQITFTVLALLETAGWTAAVVDRARHGAGLLALVTAIVALVSWVYAALRPNIRPSRTPYYDLLTIYFSHFLAACVALYESSTSATGSIGFSTDRLAHVISSLLTFVGLAAIVNMPLSLTGKPEVDEDCIGLASVTRGLLYSLAMDDIHLGQPHHFVGSCPTSRRKRCVETQPVHAHSNLMRKFLQVQRPSLLRRILVANAMDLFLDGSLTVISTLMNFSAPFFLNLTLRAMFDDNQSRHHSIFLPTWIRTFGGAEQAFTSAIESPRKLQRSDAYFFAIAAFVCQLIKSQSDLQHLYFSRRASVRVKGELVASVYEKALKRKDVTGAVQKNQEKDTSEIVSLIAADSERVSRFVSMGPFIYDAPLSIIIACTMLYNLMGWTAFAGYVALLIALPINTVIVRRTSSFQRSVSSMRDRRMRAMNEAIQSIKFIKFSAWESRWINRVLEARSDELKWLRKLKISFFFLGMIQETADVDIAFPCITVFSMLSQSLTALPMIANWFVMCMVAVKRIEKYLSEEEVPEYVSSLRRAAPSPHEPVDSRIGCAGATFRWPEAPTDDAQKKETKPGSFPRSAPPGGLSLGSLAAYSFSLRLKKRPEEVPKGDDGDDRPEPEDVPEKPFELKNVSIVFPEGVMSLVSGPTGSGKSSLLAALLGEMDRIEGEVYLPKEPTRLNEKTGLPMTISYCAQQPWLEHKTIKDNILFGSPYDKERYEATLSCCALLPDLAVLEDGDQTEIGEKARTQVVLMDDVLSAVDSHTAELIVKRCFLGPLMKHRTVILLYEGQVESQGTVAQLRESGALSSIRAGQKEIELTEEVITTESGEDQTGGPKDPNKTARKLVEDEKKASGSVGIAVYKTYLSAASYVLFCFLVLFLLSDELSKLFQKFWIKYWSESYMTQDAQVYTSSGWLEWKFPPANQNVLPYLLVYIGIQAWISFINIISQIPSIMSTLRASRLLYEKMLRSVMRSPSRFFDKTPSGRILNRFRPSRFHDTSAQSDDHTLVAVGTIVYAVPVFIVPAIVIAYIHLWFARGYINASRDLRRIESNTRSPIVSSFSELVVGIVTVRAFGSEKSFLNNMYKRVDRTQAATHYYWMCNRWLLFRFDSLGALSVLIATAGSLLGGASAGLAGIVIVQAQAYVRGLYWGLRFWTELEQSLNSVERVQEYLDLPSEPPAVIESHRPPAAWPSATKGTLVFEDLELKYSPELEPVLKGVSFETKPAERIGIVGRTGSGKSTLALALFRFVDPSAGKIILDGIDITTIGLDDLRSQLTLIPQDAVLFNGTIRENLDPFNEYTDAECIEALQRVHLRTTDSPGRSLATSRAASIKDAPSTPGGTGSGRTIFTLETKVSEGGNNFSQGQRQLLSMARALLRKSSVIVMDESTASVDFETDAKIQTTIREEFNQSILLTIAHRLRTIIDNDRILVLNAGRVVEFDTPANLLKKPDGVFHEMCKKSGDYDELLEMAESKARS